MKKITIPVPSEISVGGAEYRLLSLNVGIQARSLSGSFSASFAGDGTPLIGDEVSVAGFLSGGIVTQTQYSGGAWSISGEGAGHRLSRSTPGAGAIKATSIGGIIAELAEFCGLTADVSLRNDPLPGGVDARSLLPEGTCADAILHLAGLCGAIAVVPLDRTEVVVRAARPSKLKPPTVLSKSGESLDTDGYATGVAVSLSRKGSPPEGGGEDDEGENPEGLRRETRSGTAPIDGGTVRWRVTMILPLGVVEDTTTEVELPEQGIIKRTSSTYDYRIDETQAIREGRQYRCWRYGLRGARDVEEEEWKSLGDAGPGWARNIREITRSFDAGFSRVDREEELERRETSPTGTPLPPIPFSRRVVRSFSWDDERRGIQEREERYEETDTGRVDYVLREDGTPAAYEGGGFVVLPQFQRTGLVRHVRTRTTDEVYSDAGECVLSVSRETDDRGMADLLSRGLVVGEAEIRAAKEFLLALPRQGEFNVNTSPGGSALPQGVSFFSLPGKRVGGPPQGGSSRMDAPSGMHCPFIMETLGCGVKGGACSYFDPQKGTPGFLLCGTYRDASEASEDAAAVDAPPVFALAGGGTIWHEASVYLDAELTDSEAQAIARTIAENILHVKQCSRGIVTSATIPLQKNLLPDGGIIAVSHDLKSLTTSVTWAPCDRTPPEALLITRMSSLAAAVFGRESVGKGREAPGRVAAISGGEATVLVAAHPVQCRSFRGLEVGQSVLVYLPPGSTTRGQIRR